MAVKVLQGGVGSSDGVAQTVKEEVQVKCGYCVHAKSGNEGVRHILVRDMGKVA